MRKTLDVSQSRISQSSRGICEIKKKAFEELRIPKTLEGSEHDALVRHKREK